MRTATFLITGALGLACAHQSAPKSEGAKATPMPEQKAQALSASETGTGSPSGDPRLGNLELANAPAAPRAEVADNANQAAGPNSAATPRAIEPAAPTAFAAPPGSALTPPAAQAASKDEADLRARIQSRLLHESSLSFTAKRVRVEIERGSVTLLGEVRTAREKNEVEDLVQKVSGVRRVTNRLAVIDQPVGGKALQP